MVAKRLEEKGVCLKRDGEKLMAYAKDGLTEEQRAYIRTHKQELLAELRARETLPPALEERIHSVAAKLTRDCASWYRDDAEILAQMTDADLEKTVADYLSKRDFYNRGLTTSSTNSNRRGQ